MNSFKKSTSENDYSSSAALGYPNIVALETLSEETESDLLEKELPEKEESCIDHDDDLADRIRAKEKEAQNETDSESVNSPYNDVTINNY